jgi:2,4'-dihydroxyacetophenone dioxygenase
MMTAQSKASAYGTPGDAAAIAARMAADPRAVEKVRDDQSGYFADGSHICRVESLPWTPFLIPNSVFRLLHCDWKHDMYIMMLIVPGKVPVDMHYHIAEAAGYIMTGEDARAFEYEYGRVFAGDYIAEGPDIEHSAIIGADDVKQLSIIFGGLTAALPTGGPDLSTYFGCKEVYDLAKADGGADHLAPPPPGWVSPHYQAAMEKYGHLQPQD